MNSYRKFIISTYYSPNNTKEDSSNYIPITGHYIKGFIARYGYLSLNLKGNRFGYIYLSIGQHKKKQTFIEKSSEVF